MEPKISEYDEKDGCKVNNEYQYRIFMQNSIKGYIWYLFLSDENSVWTSAGKLPHLYDGKTL